ncbi:MAG TPA: large-conductance mechanosensitive channel protein MscL [Thermoanaerobaculia bacterium]
MSLVKEFKEFALKGSVVDLAVGVMIGAAFGKFVDSLVKDVLMPPLAVLTGGLDFTNKFLTLKGASATTLADAQAAGAVTLNYGLFLNALVNFLIVAFAIFIVIKRINALRRKPAEVTKVPSTHACPECLSEIPLDAKRCRFCAVALTPPPAVVAG